MTEIERELAREGWAEAEKFRAQWQHVHTPTDLERLMKSMYRRFDELFREKHVQSGDHIDCKAGCSFCCYLEVDAIPCEVLVLAEHIKRNCQGQLREMQEQAKVNRQSISDLAPRERVDILRPCPLLKDGRCSCYEVRPMVCRKYQSPSVRQCENVLKSPGEKGTRVEVREIGLTLTGFIAGVWSLHEEIELDSAPYDLSSALDEALSNPKSFRRWRDGKRAFPKDLMARDSEGNED